MNIKKIKNMVSVMGIIFLGGFMVKGGINKFLSTSKSSHEIIERAQDLLNSDEEEKLKKTLYINGLKQTGFFWPLLGICELLFGLLLFLPNTRLFSALMLVPITLQIFLFHLFLESDEISELILTLGLFLTNLIIIYLKKSTFLKLFET
tara:strand:- start:4175 stop:4621 length:447 start_codon:yes stop_codon:yes gene_type:complete